MTAEQAAEVSVYDRLVWPEGVIEHLLATGQRRLALHAYLGEAECRTLEPMAVAAANATRDPQRCVFLVPGLMGSQLSLPREPPLPDNLLWLDPVDIHQGNLSLLALSRLPIRACGPVLYNYLPLKLALEAAGYTVRYFDHDWRRDIGELGVLLSRRIAAESARDISVVGHSMGGLVARAALLTEAGERVQRVITLGTPHGGSYAPAQALRGVYPLVRRLAQLDPTRSAEVLARDVFATFHSLYQMLPQGGTLNLLDSRNWPRGGPQPNATLLDRVARLNLGGSDPRICAIAGYGHKTVVNIARVQDDFLYRYDLAGDGTVPTERATLPGCEAWYCNVAHSELPRSTVVHQAVINLLRDSVPTLVGAPPALGYSPGMVSDSELRMRFSDKISWEKLNAAQRRDFLDSLNTAYDPTS